MYINLQVMYILWSKWDIYTTYVKKHISSHNHTADPRKSFILAIYFYSRFVSPYIFISQFYITIIIMNQHVKSTSPSVMYLMHNEQLTLIQMKIKILRLTQDNGVTYENIAFRKIDCLERRTAIVCRRNSWSAQTFFS